MRLTIARSVGLLLVVLSVVAAPLTLSSGFPSDEDWVVDEDTALRDDVVHVTGDVLILPGVRLTMEGSELRIGGQLHVHPNATLDLQYTTSGSSNQIAPLGDDSRFWIHVEGLMLSHGNTAGEIRGLWGDGLTATLPGNEGGIRISGEAVLEGVHIHNGTAGLFVDKNASLEMSGSVVEYLGEAGITTLGSLTLDDTIIAHNEIGVIGKDTCDIRIKNSFFLDSLMEQVVVNGCRATIQDSLVQGGEIAVVANNAANVTVQKTALRDYGIEALGSYASPSHGDMLRPVVRFHDVVLEPAAGAKRGADIVGARLMEFVNVTLTGHAGHGIQAQTSQLLIRDSTIHSNQGYGIRLAGGLFIDDPTVNGNRFQAQQEETRNGEGPVSHVSIHQFWVLDEEGSPVELDENIQVRVFSDGYTQPMEIQGQRSLGYGAVEVQFEGFGTDGMGKATFMGPFSYEASHPVQTQPWTGPLESGQGTVSLTLETGDPASGPVTELGIGSLGVISVGIVLIAYSVHRSHRYKNKPIRRPSDDPV